MTQPQGEGGRFWTMSNKTMDASAWYEEIFHPDPAAPGPTPERQAQFETWLRDPENRDAIYSIISLSDGLKMAGSLPARTAREWFGNDYEPMLICLDGGRADE
jgi:hypothetical protein